MSLAGVRSSRGDTYQVCVAMEWAIRMIKDVNIAWMELDSTRVIAGGIPAPVDDIIIGWAHGKETCCQCKKNETGFVAWRVAELEDDLKKAAKHLVADTNAEVRFYSRADFGDLARLVDRARQMPDITAFSTAMPKDLLPELGKLSAAWANALASGTQDVRQLLLRITFQPTLVVDDFPAHLKVELAQIVTRVEDAYNALWTTVDNLGARTVSSHLVVDPHRITRDELLNLLQGKGCAITAPRAEAEIRSKFAAMSSIGREWRREIGGQRVASEAVNALLAAAETKAKLLLTDGPGSGKTCVLLETVDRLEARRDSATLFLQAREFADSPNQAGRVALGLDPDIPALVSAMSQWKRVFVVIDSLDVLSLNRETECLTYFLSLVDRLVAIPNVCVIAACRSFDLRYNKKLSVRGWDETVEIGLLDWGAVVEPLLTGLGIDTLSIDQATRALIGNPRNLALFTDLVARSPRRNVASAQELTEVYLDVVVASEPDLGSTAMIAIETMASEMLSKRRHQLPRGRIDVGDSMLRRLCSTNVLYESGHHEIGFGHQTLLDALAVREALRRGMTLLAYIQSLQPVPFIRPAIRAFFLNLRLGDRATFRANVREVFDADVAFHLKRLIAESYAVCEPDDSDWSLIRHLFRNHPAHFRSIYDGGTQLVWHRFWMRFLVPLLQTEGNAAWLEVHFGKLRKWADDDPVGVFAFWADFATGRRAKGGNLRGQLGIALNGFKSLTKVDAQALLEALVELPSAGRDFLGNSLLKWARHDPRGDALLWRYVAADVPAAPKRMREIEEALHCDESFLKPGEFAERLAVSDVLLSLAITSLESWSTSLAKASAQDGGTLVTGPNDHFLDKTSFQITHSRHEIRHTTTLGTLVQAVEKAVLKHADLHDEWWQAHSRRIGLSDCGALRYMGILAMTQFPAANGGLAKEFFTDDKRAKLTDRYELGNLIAAASHALGDALDLVERHISQRLVEHLPLGQRWVNEERYSLLCRIPASLRSAEAMSSIAALATELAPPDHQPDIFSSSGFVGAPFESGTMTSLSDDALIKLMVFSQSLGRGPMPTRELMGGTDSVNLLLHTAASVEPRRFLNFLAVRWIDLPDSCKIAILGGAADYLRFRYGNVTATHWKPKEDISATELAELLVAELERHPSFWTGTREASTALSGCARVVTGDTDLERLAFLAASHSTAEDPLCGERQDDDLIGTAINSSRGELAEGLMVLAERLFREDRTPPALLAPTLMRLARDCHPAVRATVIGRLAFIQSKSELGWQLFEAAFSDDDQRVWTHGAESLYHCTGDKFVRAKPYLDRMEHSPLIEVLKAWGRLSALAVLDRQLSLQDLLSKLVLLQNESAWSGAISVWAANAGSSEFASTCFEALELAASQAIARPALHRKLSTLFKPRQPIARVPMKLLRVACVQGGAGELTAGNLPPQMDEWLCVLAEVDPDEALELAETMAEICKARDTLPFYDPAPLGALLTSLFREAEERESSDGRQMLRRVVALQDVFLSMPTSGLGDWLHAAERPDA